MREFSTPSTISIPDSGNLTDDVVNHSREAADEVVFRRRVAAGLEDVTAREFHAEVCATAKGLIAAGVEAGDRVAVISRTRYEWTLLDYAVWFAGAVTVPLYESSSVEQVAWILQDSGAAAVVVEGPEHLARVRQAQRSGALDDLSLVWSLSDQALDNLGRLGQDISDETLERRRATATPLDLATIVYTSGTTAAPKGCMLTHGNFMFELGVTVEELGEVFDDEEASTLVFLPLAHVFARIIQVGAVKRRVPLGHSSDIKDLAADLDAFRPTFLLAVPRVFEKVFNTASQQATAAGHGKLFGRAANAAIAYSRALDDKRVPLRVRTQRALYDKLVYSQVREALGGRCRYAISGGAPLGERLGHVFRGIGVTVLEGYGLTESTGALTVNLPHAHKIGTVGRPLPGTTVRVADDGELLFRGGQVFAGYWNDDRATAQALDPDGWLHTGDVGEVDDEGFVRITGRRKEILVTTGGKNVSPTLLEERVRAHDLVDHCLVVGDGQPFIGALVTIDRAAYAGLAGTSGLPREVADALSHPVLVSAVQAAVDDANGAVSQAEAIRKFVILAQEWTEEGGQLTPSLKLKRHVVTREHRSEIEDLYLF
ncbi:long-chain fatty acid--CoA ligase [Nocardioides seonyuensis]|uniref:Acyl-CoA synthetase n=1 Tax=Nocardioides seonyuensis TaxID=2518371 RepID=A0A4P7IBZ1_9ACTN|nr:AMP-dependent synthetase/ligase [Nocardioides seonyuensis]QBX54080.1 long-chain fatty acid--CoA ligase [Nocardioides seonyuensis]